MEPRGREPRRPPGREPHLRRAGGLGAPGPQRVLSDLGSAPLPAPGDDDHVRGAPGAPLLIEYASFECQFCALAHDRLTGLPLRRIFRHFPVRAKHPRAWATACAAEAAGLQGAFWPMHDALYADQGRLDDPHLWAHARALGLDLERLDADRRSAQVADRVQRDTREALAAGATTTPTLFAAGIALAGVPDDEWLDRLGYDGSVRLPKTTKKLATPTEGRA